MDRQYNTIPRSIPTKAHSAQFMIKDPVFEKMRPKFESLATAIRQAVNEKRRIFIKHHADCDGFCAGIALERAIIPLIEAVNDKRQAAWEKFRRMPSVTPFYHIEDVTKDIAQFLMMEQKFGEELPFVILVDLGSGPENVLPIKKLQIFGCDVAIIDHHPIDAQVNTLVSHHINPLHYQSEISYSAGILCAELSRFINSSIADEQILAAISCIGDHVEESVTSRYLAMVEKDGYNKEFLTKIAKSVDFEVFNLRGVEGRELVGVLLGDNKTYQKKVVDLIYEELKTREDKILAQAASLIKIHETKSIAYVTFPVSDLQVRDSYPRLGTMVGLVHDKCITDKRSSKPIVTIGTTANSMTFRAQDGSPFNFPQLLKHVQEKVPVGFVEGGGHPQAGTFRFPEIQHEQVQKALLEYLEQL